MGRFAWVTLATNDSYSLGALVVASSLKRVNTAHELVVLVTPGVSESMISKLRSVFNLVEEVNVLDSQDAAHLALLKRPELGITFTKLHCWRLTQYDKCVFLDADTLILQNSDELFEREELSAAPDVGWPDCFNSGVFVYQPSLDTFGKLVDFASTKGSFDGGDQGLLNQYFNDWATKDIAKRLPFIYNTTTTAVYSYIPAFKQFGDNLKILHFIGNVKPWLLNFDPQSKTVQSPSGYQHLTTFLQLWWTIFCDDVHPNLSPEMNKSRSSYGSTENNQPVDFLYVPPTFELLPSPKPNIYNTEKEINYYDPWENYDRYNTSANSYIDNNQYLPENNNTKLNEPIYEEIHNNNLEVAHNYLTENVIPMGHNEAITNTSLDDNTKRVILSSSNASLIHSPSAEILSNEISFEEVNNTNHNDNFLLAHGNDINLNITVINHAKEVIDPLPENQDDNNSSANESGIAGALAKLTLGVNRSPEQQEFENHMRRQCWESGNIDYLGKDSFDNIWRRITQTIESGTKQDIPAATQSEPSSQPKSTSLPDEKLKVDIAKVTLSASGSGDELLYPNERNVIAVCSPHELMRSLSSPGLAQEQIITTVLPCGKIVQQKILSFPEREIIIEDYERIEILGSITRKITTETTRIIPGKEDQKEVTIRTEIHPQDTEKNAIIEKQQTVSQNTLTTQSESQSQQIETNQNNIVATKPTNSPKISITDVLKPLPDDKVEFDSINNTTTITRKTATGYEMIIATVTPDGRNRVQTKTFFDPVEVRGTEEIEEEYTEEQVIEEGKKTTTTTSNIPNVKPIAKNSTDSAISNTTENGNTVANLPSVKVETREIVVNGRKGVEKTVTETTVTGKIILKKTITYEGVEEEEIIEESETTINQDDQTAITTTFKPDKKIESKQKVEETKDKTESKTITEVTEQTTIAENTSTTIDEGVTTTTTIEKTPTGHKEITTITTADGLTRVQTKTFYDPVEIPGEEEEIEEYEETTTTEPVITTKIETSTSTVPTSVNQSRDTQILTTTSDKNTEQNISSETTVTATVTDITRTTEETTEPVITTKIETSTSTVPTSVNPTRDTQILTTTSDKNTEQNISSEKTVTATVTDITTTEEITVISNEVTSKSQITDPPLQDPSTTKPELPLAIETTTTENITTQIVPGEEKTTVTIEKTPTGHKEITTITTVDGLTRVQTKTFYDPVEIPGEEEEIEEYEETTTTEPVVTTKVATNTQTTKATSDINLEETNVTEEILTTTVTDVTTNVKTPEQITVISKEDTSKPENINPLNQDPSINKSETKTTSTVGVAIESTITENITTQSIPSEEKTTVTIEETPIGHKEIATITTTDSLKTDKNDSTHVRTEEIIEETNTTTTVTTNLATNETVVAETTLVSKETPAAINVITKNPNDTSATSVEIYEETIITENTTTNDKLPINKTSETTIDTSKTSTSDTIEKTIVSNISGTATNKNKTTINTTIAQATEKTEPAKSKDKPDATKNKSDSTKKIDTIKTNTVESEVTSTTTKTGKIVAKPTVAEEKTSVTIEKTATGHKEITTIVSADGEIRIRTKTFYDPVEQEEEEVEEYEETHTTEPTVTTIKKAVTQNAPQVETTSNETKTVTEIETTTETLNIKTPQKLDKKKTVLQKVGKEAGAVTSVIGQETITTTQTKNTTTDISKTVKRQTDKSSTTTEKTKTLKDSKTVVADSEKKSDKTKSTTKQIQQATPQGEPQKIVTTKRVENGTEHTITTIFPDGTKKIEKKTFFDAVEVSGDEEEEEIEEYEEIEEEEPVVEKPKPAEPPKKAPAPTEPARKKIVAPVAEPKPTKEDSQFQPSKLKIPAAFAAANAQASGPVRPILRKAAPKAPTASTAGTAAANGTTKDTPVPPPRKKEVGKLFKTSMLLLLLISLALIYNHCVKPKS